MRIFITLACLLLTANVAQADYLSKAEQDKWLQLWPKEVPIPNGIRAYRKEPAFTVIKLDDPEKKVRLSVREFLPSINRQHPWVVPGGLANVDPRTYRSVTLIVLPDDVKYYKSKGEWEFPEGTTLFDLLVSIKNQFQSGRLIETGKTFELRQRKFIGGSWKSHTAFEDEAERPPGYTGLDQRCHSCHNLTGNDGLRGRNTTVFSWHPFSPKLDGTWTANPEFLKKTVGATIDSSDPFSLSNKRKEDKVKLAITAVAAMALAQSDPKMMTYEQILQHKIKEYSQQLQNARIANAAPADLAFLEFQRERLKQIVKEEQMLQKGIRPPIIIEERYGPDGQKISQKVLGIDDHCPPDRLKEPDRVKEPEQKKSKPLDEPEQKKEPEPGQGRGLQLSSDEVRTLQEMIRILQSMLPKKE